MSGLGLGGYASSDEDDDSSALEVLPDPVSKQEAGSSKPWSNDSVKDKDIATKEDLDGNADAAVANYGPMVGPSMPEQVDDNRSVEQEEPSPDPQQHMSERETIHYLTQATYPMTSIPSSPPGSPDPAIDAKFKRFLELKSKGIHFNEDLANKSTFRNPGLQASMMARMGLEGDDQYKTSLPLDVWDPTGFPSSAYKEELLRSQHSQREQEQAAKKSLSAAGKRTINFTPAGTSGTSSRESTPGIPNKRKRH